MRVDMIKLFKWFDNRTCGSMWSKPFAEHLAKQKNIPKTLREAHKAFKKSNKARRISLASYYINEVLSIL